MNFFKKLIKYYLAGVVIASIIIGFLIVFDYLICNQFTYPELGNFTLVSLISGLGFGLTYYSFEKLINPKK